jgi:hypothetical protein
LSDFTALAHFAAPAKCRFAAHRPVLPHIEIEIKRIVRHAASCDENGRWLKKSLGLEICRVRLQACELSM